MAVEKITMLFNTAVNIYVLLIYKQYTCSGIAPID